MPQKNVVTVIIIFSVEPERQQEIVDTTVEFLSTVKQHPGFISSSIHKSTDGNKIPTMPSGEAWKFTKLLLITPICNQKELSFQSLINPTLTSTKLLFQSQNLVDLKFPRVVISLTLLNFGCSQKNNFA
ncbi:MAG: hypothetical protein BRC47_04310 [Cyanobacteria bacterium QS_7_48_42]|nr:MAG: hypothetical protein BRC47_04310 [Cyanobacteria bacterium QS_7_48_42]PSP13135.1 MAG: hypothetical protein BRC49_03145 [Cyanobacteria bacterium SW_10_48_33]